MARVSTLIAALLVLNWGSTYAQTLVYGHSGWPSSLDSADSQDGVSLTVSLNVGEPLMGFGEDGMEVVPLLATSWTHSADLTVWTLQLREGVAFHDGTPFDAEAAKFNLDRWNDPAHPHAHRTAGKQYVPWTWLFGGVRGDGSVLEEVRVVDRYTLELELTRAVPLLPHMLASKYFQMHSPAAIRQAGPSYGLPGVGSVGTGPFEFVEWIEGQRVVLRRNDAYWGDVADVETVLFRAFAEATSRMAELMAGSIDIALNLVPDDLAALRSHPDLNAVTPTGELNLGYLGMHQANEPFDDLRVRQAVAHAIDREALVDAFYRGRGTVAADFLPPNLWGHADLEPYTYDPRRARALLAEAGYPDGFVTELWYLPINGPIYPAPRAMAEVMATYLAAVGIDARLRTEDFTAYLADYARGEFPMYLLGWVADYPDPDTFLYSLLGPDARDTFGWDDAETVALLERARGMADRSEREALYARAQERVRAQVPAIPLMNSASVHGTRSDVSGFVVSPLGPGLLPLNHVRKEQ